MSRQLVMKLSPEATQKYLAIISKTTEAEVNADCEPSGASIEITFDHIFASAVLITSQGRINLGDADVDLVEGE